MLTTSLCASHPAPLALAHVRAAEFVEVLSPSHVRMVVWERGAGRTLACGTGACATVVAGVLEGAVDRSCQVGWDWDQQDTSWQARRGLCCRGVALVCFSSLDPMCCVVGPLFPGRLARDLLSHPPCVFPPFTGGPPRRPAAH